MKTKKQTPETIWIYFSEGLIQRIHKYGKPQIWTQLTILENLFPLKEMKALEKQRGAEDSLHAG